MTWYTWSNITSSKDKAGRPLVIPVGTTVTPKILGVTREQFDGLIAVRAVRAEPYPDIAKGSTMSPAELLRRRIAVEEGRLEPEDLMKGTQVVRISPDTPVPGLIKPDGSGQPPEELRA